MKKVRKLTIEHKTKIGLSNKGNVMSKETREKMSRAKLGHIPWNKGITYSDDYKEKLSKAKKGKIGPLSNNWQGGKTPEVQKARNSDKYLIWRNDVYKRDNYTCQVSGEESKGDLEAHHINNFSSNKEIRFDINNGITMKKSIHNLFHRLYGKHDNNYEQIIDFMDTIKQMEGVYV